MQLRHTKVQTENTLFLLTIWACVYPSSRSMTNVYKLAFIQNFVVFHHYCYYFLLFFFLFSFHFHVIRLLPTLMRRSYFRGGNCDFNYEKQMNENYV